MIDLNKLPTIPQYFQQYVDPKIDLSVTSSIPCPFHNEKVGKSFSYSKTLNVWRCWGQCHCGGDVIDLHRLNYRLKSKKDAEESLCAVLHIKPETSVSFEEKKVEVDEREVYRRRVYATALKLANTPDDWLELDYILSKVPYDVRELEVFCNTHGYSVASKNNYT